MNDPLSSHGVSIPTRQRQLYIFWMVFTLAATLAAVGTHFLIGLSNDTLLLTRQAQQLLSGGVPYTDFADVNPPMSFLIFTPVVLFAGLTGMSMMASLNLLTALLGLLSLTLSARIMRCNALHARTCWIALSGLALAFFVLSFLHQSYGDREHLMMMLITPWLVYCSPFVKRENVRPACRFAAAMLAGIGFTIKPYAYVLYAIGLVFMLAGGKSIRALLREPEHYVVGGIGILYLIAVRIWFGEFLTTIMPVAMETYRYFSWPWESKWDVIGKYLLGSYGLPGLIAAITLWFWAPAYAGRTIGYVAALLFGAIVMYATSGGWYYTQYPFNCMALLLLIAASARLIEACAARRHVMGMLAVALATLGALGFYYGKPLQWRIGWDLEVQKNNGQPMGNLLPSKTVLSQLQAHFAVRPSFLLISVDVWGVNFMTPGTARNQVGRFDYLWPLPGTVALSNKPERKADYDRLVTYLGESLAEDIVRHRPDMLIVDVSPEKRVLPPSYDMLKLFKTVPPFAKAFGDYARTDIIQECDNQNKARCAYEIYYRK